MTKTSSPMMAALKGRIPARKPVWLMRQAGRYLPEYRALRAEAGSFMALCFNPALAAEVTLQPLRRFDLDAAILFSDILVIPHALGQKLDFVEGEGPRLQQLSSVTLDTENLETVLQPVYETIRRVRAELSPDKALIGFAGAPWTVACYMIETRGTKTFNRACDIMRERPADFGKIIDVVTDATITYLSSQIDNGADCVQLFDSWAGLLTDEAFEKWAIAPVRKIVTAIKQKHPDTPVIGFPRQAGEKYKTYAAKTGVDAVGMDHDADLSFVPADICIQGNLSPDILLSGGAALEKAVEKIISATAGRPHIFNLGHGVIKETPPAHIEQLVTLIRKHDNGNRG